MPPQTSPQCSAPSNPTRGRSSLRALVAAALTTVLVTGISYGFRDYAATAVGLAFFGVTGWLVLRRDAATIRHYGLSLGGLLEPEPIAWRETLASGLRALGWAAAVAVIVFPPFVIGFRLYWHVHGSFHLRWPQSWTDDDLGQLLVVALPEESFYRGYLMTALDDAWGTPWKFGKTRVGWGLVVSCAVFAIGHLMTDPNPGRLAVFFPALLFGCLRARTGGIGAGAVFHAMCNLLSSTIARGYGLGG